MNDPQIGGMVNGVVEHLHHRQVLNSNFLFASIVVPRALLKKPSKRLRVDEKLLSARLVQKRMAYNKASQVDVMHIQADKSKRFIISVHQSN